MEPFEVILLGPIVLVGLAGLHVLLCALTRIVLALVFGRPLACWLGEHRGVWSGHALGLDWDLRAVPFGAEVLWIPAGRALLGERLALVALAPMVVTLLLLAWLVPAFVQIDRDESAQGIRTFVILGALVVLTFDLAHQLLSRTRRQLGVRTAIDSLHLSADGLSQLVAECARARWSAAAIATMRRADPERLSALASRPPDSTAAVAIWALEYRSIADWLRGDLDGAWHSLCAAQRRVDELEDARVGGRDDPDWQAMSNRVAMNTAFIAAERGELTTADELSVDRCESEEQEAGILRTRGHIEVLLGQIDEGSAKLARAWRFTREEAVYRSFTAAHLARAALRSGDAARARLWLDRAARLWPRSPLVERLRRELDGLKGAGPSRGGTRP
jgi:hypothetical protein